MADDEEAVLTFEEGTDGSDAWWTTKGLANPVEGVVGLEPRRTRTGDPAYPCGGAG